VFFFFFCKLSLFTFETIDFSNHDSFCANG